MSRLSWGYLVYGVWFASWVGLEVSSLLFRTPWPTLSRTVWGLQDRFRIAAVLIFAGLQVLALHLAFRWPRKPSS